MFKYYSIFFIHVITINIYENFHSCEIFHNKLKTNYYDIVKNFNSEFMLYILKRFLISAP